MDIKCNLNSYYVPKRRTPQSCVFNGSQRTLQVKSRIEESKKEDIFVKRPDAAKSASGLSGIRMKFANVVHSVADYGKSYKKNIKHTYDHKIVFALIEKELYGCHSIDSYTHDADKMILYLLGFPKSFVSKFHREHSVHHVESGKKMNLRSMLCDNIASSPEFKPEKKNSLRAYYAKSKELQSVKGFGDLLIKYNYGENLDFDKIKQLRAVKFEGMKGFVRVAMRAILFMVFPH